MSATSDFFIREIDDNDSVPYVILIAATDSHSEPASRLVGSIKELGLPFVSLRIPAIHRSVSPNGTDDLDYCKAHLISTVMADLKRPIFYLDSDVVVKSRPFLIEYLCAEDYDFGVFNWLALGSNQAYKPTDARRSESVVYRFSHSIDAISRTQLICSGAVQYWGYSNKSSELINLWRDCVANNPGCPDDHSLDYAVNNLNSADELKSFWLPRAYARYAWWVLDAPVIDHPDYPNPGSGFTPLSEFRGKPRVHMDQLSPRLLTTQEETLKCVDFVVGPGGVPQAVR